MELLATLTNINNLEKILNIGIDGIIIGSIFSIDYDYDLEEFKEIVYALDKKGIKKYVVIDQIISESDKLLLYQYLEIIKDLDFDGIYFHDLAIYQIGCDFGLKDKLIFDGQSILTNSLDVAFYLSKGINGVLLSRELTLEEIKSIVNNNENVDLQVFGRLRLSYSKRKFIDDYFKEIKKLYTGDNKNNLSLVEEKRDYHLPIRQRSFGTIIYSDYIFEMYVELPEIKKNIKRIIISDLLMKEDIFIKALRDYKRITKENAYFLKESLFNSFKGVSFSTGYLYQKTNKEKQNEES